MNAPAPSRRLLAQQIRWARSRGLPVQDAEDLVFEAWQDASASFDPAKGAFSAYLGAIVRQRCALWWRRQAQTRRALEGAGRLRLVQQDEAPVDRSRHEALLAALDDEERRIFHAWALQKQLGKGRIRSAEVAASLGLDPQAYDNAKRRLRSRLHRLLEAQGWDVVYEGGDDAFGG